MLAKGICVNEEQVIVGGSSDKPLEIIKVQIANAASRLAGEIKVEGRVKDEVPHLTKVGALNVGVSLEENIILCRQASHQPNIIGRVVCILAKENVNISSMNWTFKRAGRARKLPFLECKQASDSPSSEGKGHSGSD
nr:D-3-phosphoglycerate dehydrogenase 1, chloroplastic [Tanacetum cinerariifolium]